MKKNLLKDIPNRLPEELIETLVENQGIKIERIVSRGHRSPPGFWYDQQANEFVLLLSGAAVLLLEGEDLPRRLEAGDCLLVPPRRRHRVEWTDPDRDTVWLTVYFPAKA